MNVRTHLLRLIAKLVSRRRALGRVLRPLARRAGFSQVLLSRRTIEAELATGVLTVPYGLRSTLLGLGVFPLALDGPAHTASRIAITAAIQGSQDRHQDGVNAAQELVSGCLADAGPRLDLIGAVLRPALHVWMERWTGLVGLGPTLERAGCIAHQAIFINNGDVTGKSDVIVDVRRACNEMASALTTIETAIGAAYADGASAAPNSLVARLVTAAGPLTDDAIRAVARDIVGLCVGPLALGSLALAAMFDELLDSDDPITTTDEQRQFVLRTLAMRPPIPGVVRTCPVNRPVWEAPQASLGPGRVLALTSVVSLAEPPPTTQDGSLVFGAGAHRCLGGAQAVELATALLEPFSERRPTRYSGPGGQLTPQPSNYTSWPFPGLLFATLPPTS
jgi:cytochrome P450